MLMRPTPCHSGFLPSSPSRIFTQTPMGFGPASRPCLYLSFTAEDPQLGPESRSVGTMGRAPFEGWACPIPHFKSCLTSGVKTPAQVAPLGRAVAPPAPPVFRGLVML